MDPVILYSIVVTTIFLAWIVFVIRSYNKNYNQKND